jgi:hypothetical protein
MCSSIKQKHEEEETCGRREYCKPYSMIGLYPNITVEPLKGFKKCEIFSSACTWQSCCIYDLLLLLSYLFLSLKLSRIWDYAMDKDSWCLGSCQSCLLPYWNGMRKGLCWLL